MSRLNSLSSRVRTWLIKLVEMGQISSEQADECQRILDGAETARPWREKPIDPTVLNGGLWRELDTEELEPTPGESVFSSWSLVEKKALAYHLHKRGISTNHLAALFGCGDRTMRRWLRTVQPTAKKTSPPG